MSAGQKERPGREDELLPDRTRDERDEGWGEREVDDDDRLWREVPPHHGS